MEWLALSLIVLAAAAIWSFAYALHRNKQREQASIDAARMRARMEPEKTFDELMTERFMQDQF